MPCETLARIGDPSLSMVSPEEVAADIGALFKLSGKFKLKLKGKFLKKVGRTAKGIIKSPVIKATATGLAVAYPPVGVPASAALVAANAVVRHTESQDKKKRTLARGLVKSTAKAAKAGDQDAQRGLATLLVAKRLRKARLEAMRKRYAARKGKAAKRRARWRCRPPVLRGVLVIRRRRRLVGIRGHWCRARRVRP